jgi:hypothetical protein
MADMPWRAVADRLARALTECDPHSSGESADEDARVRADALRVYWANVAVALDDKQGDA